METKETYYLDCYYKWMRSGKIPDIGLCNCPVSASDFEPPATEFPEHYVHGFSGYWGYDGEPLASHVSFFPEACRNRRISMDRAKYEFTPLRQTIVLFLAAMNNEL